MRYINLKICIEIGDDKEYDACSIEPRINNNRGGKKSEWNGLTVLHVEYCLLPQ